MAAAVAFVLAIVATPREAVWAFAAYAAVVASLTLIAGVPFGTVVRRLAIELPFLLFVVALPFLARGERVDVLGLSLSIEGLWAAGNVFAKATLGAATMILLTATTSISAILRGLQRLRVPSAFIGIAGFMVRYGDVIVSEMRRMKIGRESRGHEPRSAWQARALASAAGTLFIRSYERGERVHLAMLARGYGGSLPEPPACGGEVRWGLAMTPPAFAALVCLGAWVAA